MNSEQHTIRIGVIGAGAIGKIHADHFARIPGVEIAAITDASRELAQNAAAEKNIATVHDSAEALLGDRDIDAVVIGVPNKWHAPLAIAAIEADKHILLEKPMALHVADAKEIVRAQRDHRKVCMIGHQMRFAWWAQAARERVAAGDLGAIYLAKCGWCRRKGIPGWGSWFTQKAVSGGGPLIDIGVHMLDLTLWLMGSPRPVAVSGATYAAFGPEKRGLGNWGTPNFDTGTFDVEDLATALVRMEDGSALALDVSWAANMDTSGNPFVHLLGHSGGISIDHGRHKFLAEHNGEPTEQDLQPPADAANERDLLSQHFIDCIRQNKEPVSPAMSGLVNNMVIEAIFESSRTGREAVLDWNL